MIHTVVDPNYKTCPYCEYCPSEKRPMHISFGRYINKIQICMEAIAKFCPVCGKQYHSNEEWIEKQNNLFEEMKDVDEYTIWDSEITDDLVQEIDNKKKNKI